MDPGVDARGATAVPGRHRVPGRGRGLRPHRRAARPGRPGARRRRGPLRGVQPALHDRGLGGRGEPEPRRGLPDPGHLPGLVGRQRRQEGPGRQPAGPVDPAARRQDLLHRDVRACGGPVLHDLARPHRLLRRRLQAGTLTGRQLTDRHREAGGRRMRIGDRDILIPTMMVGNYPKPRWYNGAGYAVVPQGNFVSDSVSYEAFEDCIAAIVLYQERAGIDVISDGRVYGGDTPYAGILYYFTERMKGYASYGPALQL